MMNCHWGSEMEFWGSHISAQLVDHAGRPHCLSPLSACNHLLGIFLLAVSHGAEPISPLGLLTHRNPCFGPSGGSEPAGSKQEGVGGIAQ